MSDRPTLETDPRRVGRAGAGVLIGGALALAVATIGGRGRRLDDRLFGWANSRFEHPRLDAFFRGITELGSLWASGAAATAMAARGRRREAADAFGAAVAMWGLGQGLKRAFMRVRPYEAELPPPVRLLIGKPKGTSWPSSHPAVLLSFVTVAARDLELPRSRRRVLAGVAGVVGASRVYLGVHYPADVAGGLLLGRAVADLWSRAVSPRILH
ncbi:MAG: phosphatase PAP2 family protein [Actinomycetota bacterium]